MSISTTSGRWTIDGGQHLAAVVGLADDLDLIRAGQHHPQPGADQRVVVDQQDADHSVARRTKSPRSFGTVLERPAGQRDALGEPDQARFPRPGPRRARSPSGG